MIMIIALTTAEKIVVSLPYIVGIICCIWLMFNIPKKEKRYQMRVSDLEEPNGLSDDDYLLMTDTSEQKSVKVKLSALKSFIKS
jgi:hypothetical protein